MEYLRTTFGFLFVLMTLLISENVLAQENDASMEVYLNLSTLTEAQKKIIQTERQKIRVSREAFKKSLTKEQINILKNPTLTKDQKRMKLVATFSERQTSLVLESETRIKGMAERIKPTLSENQRKELKGLKQRFSKLKNGDSRRIRVNKEELKRRKQKTKNNSAIDKKRTL